MIIDVHAKYDVSPEWFEEQSKRDGWAEWLCSLLAVYKVKDLDEAEKAADKLKAAGIDEKLVKAAME